MKTFEDLFQALSGMTQSERRSYDLTVYDILLGEYFQVKMNFRLCDDGVLDDGHPYFTVIYPS